MTSLTRVSRWSGLIVAGLWLVALMLDGGQPVSAGLLLASRTPTRPATATPTKSPSRTPLPTVTPTPTASPIPIKGQLYDLHWSPDSRALYVYSSEGLWRYSRDAWNKPPMLSAPPTAFGAAYTGGLVETLLGISNDLIATAGTDHTIRLWDAHTGALQKTLPALAATLNGLLFSPDGTLVVASATAPDGAVYIWDLSTGLLLTSLPGDEPANVTFDHAPTFVFSADSQTLTYLTRRGEIVEWLRPANLVRATGQQGAFVASADGSTLAIIDTTDNMRVSLFDVAANAPLQTLHSAAPFQSVAFSADKQRLFAVDGQHLWYWSLPGGKQSTLLQLVEVRDSEAGIYFSPAANVLAHVSQFGRISESDPFLEVRLQNMVSGSSDLLPAQVTAWGEQQVTPVAFSPDGSTLAVAGRNGVELWDMASHQPIALLLGYQNVPS